MVWLNHRLSFIKNFLRESTPIERIFLGGLTIFSLLVAFSMRPIQDDYFNIESVQKLGLLGYLLDTWNSHGGNMAQFLIHSVLVMPSIRSPYFFNLSIFFIFTEVMVALSCSLILRWVAIPGNYMNYRFWIPFISVICFEGLFVPGFLGAYGFSLASLAHLWPILALVLGLAAIWSNRNYKYLVIPLGFIAGNSNLSESIFSCIVIVVIIYTVVTKSKYRNSLGFIRSVWLYVFFLTTFIGTILIPIAPGFWKRATDQVGMPATIPEFIIRFTKSFASFNADLFTHPAIYLALLAGIIIGCNLHQELEQDLKNRIAFIASSALIFLGLLILGSTIAYPAWHQSMGLYIIAIPSSFSLGILGSRKLKVRAVSQKVLISALILIILLGFMYLRVGITTWNRSSEWDAAFRENICLLQEDKQSILKGAEIIYPPFHLGVEDVNTWEWMANKYRLWVGDSNFNSGVNCN